MSRFVMGEVMADRIRGSGEAELARIDSLIGVTRRTVRSAWLMTGVGLTFGIGLVTILIAALVDLAMPLPTVFRLAALLFVMVPTTLAFVAGIVRPALRELSDNHVARCVERLVPQFQSRLVTTLDLAHDPSQRHHSPAFFQRLITETTERVTGFQPTALVERKSLVLAGVFALTALLLFAGVVTIFHDRLPTALARMFLPFADIPPATSVRFRAEPGDGKVLKGEDVTIAALISKGDVREMELEFRPAGGKWQRQSLPRAADDRFEWTLARLDNSIEYRLVGGGTWTRRNRIEVVERPEIADLHRVVRFPPYMKLPEPTIGESFVLDAEGPVGSEVEVVVDVAGQAVSGEIQLLAPVTKMRPVADRRERVWFDGKIPDGARAEGNWQWDYALKFRAAHTDPAVAGQHGHGFQGAPAAFEIRPDDVICTYVFVVPGQEPEEIMLQFHDGKDWEHRAFWGADKIQVGQSNTPARVRIGDVPRAGEWVRLEVPARAVGLDGKKINGVSFTLFGGQCKWHRFGASDPPEVPERSFVVTSTLTMSRAEATADGGREPVGKESGSSTAQSFNRSTWSGTIPLMRDGFYRVEFKNELGYSNKPTGEGRLTAIVDNPPHVEVERPGVDLVLSQPQKVPLVVRADDDFGLSDISLAVQKGDSGGFVGAPISAYDEPVREDSVVAALDLELHQLKRGEFVRYRVQARDRKGQINQSREFVVRIQPDNHAADKQVAALAQQQDALQSKLDQLIEQQSKVTEAVEKVAGRERPASPSDPMAPAPPESAKNAQAAASAASKAETAKNTSKPADMPSRPTAADFEKTMAELRKELTNLTGAQDANVQLGAQIQNELNQAATQATNSKLIPEQLATQMRAAEQLFQNQALQPMRELLQSMQQAGDAQKPNPDMTAIADSAQRIQQQLEAMKQRLAALAKAQQNLKDDPAAALAQLRHDLMEQNAELTAQELKELRDFLDRLMGQMKMLEGREHELARQTKDAMPVVLPQIDQEQSKIEADAKRLLAEADEIMEAESLRDMSRRRQTDEPDAQNTPDRNSKGTPPREQDATAPPSAEMKRTNASTPKKHARAEDDEQFMPPAGVKQKLDPRFVKKAGSTQTKSATGADANAQPKNAEQDSAMKAQPEANSQTNPLRSQLARRQAETADQLHEAQQELQIPRDQLAKLLQQLREALAAGDDEAAQQLAQLMKSMDMRDAMEIALAIRQAQARVRSQQPGAQPQQAQAAPPLPPGAATQLGAALRLGMIDEFDSSNLDLAAQAVLLRMQPRLREELLKGMREDGPEAYRKFIQDYFNRLTKAKP
jgi:hypothetical protein